MAAATAAATTLTMKLLVDASSPQRRRVVFAEAGKDTVDFLFSLLAVPAGTAVKLLGKEYSIVLGCMGNLYSSAEKLDDPYVQPGAAKGAILCDTMASPAAAGPNSCLFRLLAPEPTPAASAPKRFYKCNNTYNYTCRGYVTEVRGTRCPNCGGEMTVDANLIGSPAAEPVGGQEAAAKRGFVQGGMATYTVTDDLVISPMSNVSTIALLNACAVRDFGALQERTVQIGYKEGLEILKASLQSGPALSLRALGRT